MNIMPFLLSPCVLWISTCISFLSADSISVSARLSSTVLLPCQFKRNLSQTPLIQWYTGSGPVFEGEGKNSHQGKGIFQGEGYEGRVDVPKDELLKGNCSLVLKNVRATDAGIYKSYVMGKDTVGYNTNKWDFVQDVELRIDETPMLDKETSEENSQRTNDAGSNSPNTSIISSSVVVVVVVVVVCAVIALLAILAGICYRRRTSTNR